MKALSLTVQNVKAFADKPDDLMLPTGRSCHKVLTCKI